MAGATPTGDSTARAGVLDGGAAVEAYAPPQSFLVPGPNRRVDLISRGLKGLLPARVDIPDPASVVGVYIEVVYKGRLPRPGLHDAIQATLQGRTEVNLEGRLIGGEDWGGDGAAVFYAEVGKTDRVLLDFEVEENSAQSLLLYVLRDVPSSGYQAGVYANHSGVGGSKTFSIPVPKDTRTRDIDVTIPVTEITTDGRVLDFVLTAGDRQTAFRREWGNGFRFDGECCIDTVHAVLRGVTGDFESIEVSIISPSEGLGQSYVVSGILRADIEPICAPLDVRLPEYLCTDNTVVVSAPSPGPGYSVTWDFGEGASPRTATGFGDKYVMFMREQRQPITATVEGPDCTSTETFELDVFACSRTTCALEGASVVQHPAHGNADGILELDMCVSCGSTPPYTIFYTLGGRQVKIENVDQTKPRLTGLEAGTYDRIYVVDANGCQTNVTGPVTLCDDGCGNAPTCPELACTLTGFNDFGQKRSFWIPGLQEDNVRWQWVGGTGNFTVTGEETARITGRIASLSDPDCGFEVDLRLRSRRDWTAWSALGRGWKGSRWRLDDNQHTTWDYYELVPDASTLVGTGCFSGTLQLSPRPADYHYGVQVGEGANDQNLSPGISGWFAYRGTLNGEQVSGEGDINAEGTCRFQDLTRNAVPILSCAPDYTMGCGGTTDTAPRPTINCGSEDDYTLTFEDRDLGRSPRRIERTWTVRGPGGPATCVQVLTFGDDQPPVFTKVPEDATVGCDGVETQTAEATDACGEVTVEFTETRYAEDCAGTYKLRRVWTATDESGNTATAEATIEVEDRTGPVFEAPPADIVLECEDPLPTDEPTASDGCGGRVRIDYEAVPCRAATPIYTWQDGRLVYLTEGRNPGLRYRAGMGALSLASVCSDDPQQRKRWLVTNPNDYPVYVTRVQAYAKTVYGGFVVPASSHVYFFTGQQGDAHSAEIFWTDEGGAERRAASAAGDGQCDLSPAETCTCVELRRWTATDDCGNRTAYAQKVWRRDTKAPVIRDIPADRVYASRDDVPQAPAARATDECSDATVRLSEYVFPSAGTDCDEAAVRFLFGPGSAALPVLRLGSRDFAIGEAPLQFRTNCNGTAELTGTLVDVADLSARFAVRLQLDTRRGLAEHRAAGGLAPDACDAADKSAWVFYGVGANSTLTGEGPLSGTVLSVSSDGGDFLQFGPGANRVNCKLGLSVNLAYSATGGFPGTTGHLRASYVQATLTTPGDCEDNMTIVRVYDARDECGNRAIERQISRVRDRENPTLVGVPGDATYDCSAAIPDATVTARDRGDVAVELEEAITGTACDRTIVRTWTATDACGNTATARQTIEVTDERAPVVTLTAPALRGKNNGDLLRVSCSAIPRLDESVVTVTDNCTAAPQLDFERTSVTQGDCAANGFSERIRCVWTATDDCGNETAFVLFVEFVDEESPVFTKVPPAVSLECGAALPDTQPEVFDNCTDDVTVAYAERRSNGSCADSYVVTRIWTAADACGNTAEARQRVTITDGTPPAFTGVPSAVTVSCADAFPTEQPTVSDACDRDVSVVESQARTPGADDCPGTYAVVRTWTATDNCGNVSTASQAVTVRDAVAPTVSFANALLRGFEDGQELVVMCGDVPTFNAEDLLASDDCDRAVEVAYSQTATAQTGCNDRGFVQEVTATWTATDDCGNATRISVKLLVRDNLEPVVTNVPGDITIACGTPLPTSQPTIADNCTADIDLEVEETSEREEGTCADGYRVVRRWVVTDACGNVTTVRQTVTVEDELRPTLRDVPESVTISCEDALPADVPTATDNCDADVAVTFADTRVPSGGNGGACAAGGTVTRVFTATDNCGNTATASQVITVRDRTAPTFAGVPADLTLSCATSLPSPAGAGAPRATDNCDTDVTVTHADRREPGSCPDAYRVFRTWTATDDCGNSATAQQVITVEDTAPPVFGGLPAAVTVSCDAGLPTTKPTATDDCDADVNVAVTQTRREGACPNTYVLVRLFTATDNCGNATTATQEVTVEDTDEPVFANVPADLTIACTEALPQNRPSASDNCDGTVEVREAQTTEPGDCPGNYVVKRTFTAVDKCGNEAVATQVVTVRDTEAPVFAFVPQAMSIACSEALPTEAARATDDCDEGVTVEETRERRDGACAGTYELVRLFTATDACGNSATASQVVSVSDEVAPTFAGVPADVVISCGDALPTTAPTASDDCDATPAVELDEVRRGGDCPDTYRVIRTWTATDHCGNTARATQVVRVRDQTAPTLAGIPAAVTIDCDAPLPTAAPTATDNCDADVAVEEASVRRPGACADGYQVVRTWTATDNCGNTATGSQVVTVTDAEAPTFTDVPAAVTVSCTAAVPTAEPEATDNCDTDVSLNLTQTRIDGDCADAYQLVRQWTATDNCGNVATASQVVTVRDTEAPAFTFVPVATTVSCDAALPTDQPEASDDCDRNVTLEEARETRPGECPGDYVVVRLWTATDNCGNISTASQLVTVRDTEAPVFANVPPAVAIACDAGVPDGQPTASDNCDPGPAVTESSTTTPGDCPGDYVVTRVWTATDACGNVATATQQVTVADEEPPTFTDVPAAVTLSCEGDVPTVLAKASDNCDDDVAVTVAETRRPGDCPGASVVVRTFTATDDCGNTATASQVVTFRDEVAPVFAEVPAAVTVECDGALPQNQPTATDNCDAEVAIVERQERQPGACDDNRRVIRIWTATDDCGNTATASQVVTLEDTTPPTFASVPAETTVECSDELPKDYATATDNCDREVAVTVATERQDGDCADGYTVIRVFTATDNCGNTATATQRVNVRDRTAPTFASVPQDVTVECDADLPVTMASATDNCDEQVTVSVENARVDGACTDGYTVLRTFLATDNCGNTATIQQTVTVRDTEAPVFSGVPASVDIACDAPLPTDAPVATDNCDRQVDVVETQSEEPGRCAGSFAVVRMWTATDNCGNTATATQRVRRTDTEAPRFTRVPSDARISCREALPTGLPVATDACDGDVTVTEAQTTAPGDCPGDYTVTRVFTATDDCGNAATARQVVTVEDTGRPVLAGVPAAVTIACDETVPVELPTATDDCDTDVTVTEAQEFLRSGCAGNYRIVRTFTATDDCGNTASATQLVTVQDLVAPVFADVPATVTIRCDELAPTALPTATDGCDADVDVSETQSRLPGGCDDSYTLVRTFTATDECGNRATAEQRVIVRDETAPELVGVPGDITLSCTEELPTDQPTATDNCDREVTVTESRETTTGACADSYVLVRTWTATDNCGNAVTASQRVEVGDVTAPAFTSIPLDVTVSCDEPLPTNEASATDDCSGDVNLVSTSRRETGDCLDAYRVVREWTATDACGNVATATQVVTVRDATPPVFANVPAAVSIGCDQPLPTTQPRLTDNCDEEVNVEERSRRERGDCESSYTLVRTWIATDNCGNTASASQVVTVEDRTAPVFASVPATVTIACGEPAPDGEATATDNCDTQVRVTSVEVREDGACPDSYSIVRTWTAVDDCGNAATASQVITVIDSESPVLAGVPPATAVSCAAGLPTSAPTATDDCDRDVSIEESTETLRGACPDTYIVIRTWTATDNCGNTASATQEVTVADDAGPVFARVPVSRTVDCDEDPGDEEPIATDDCDADVAITMTETTRGESCATGLQLIRTWTATDNCGNTATVSQTIRFEDREPPVIADLDRTLSVECDQPVPTVYPTATDACDREVDLAFFDVREDRDCGAVVTRTWVATDDCGNTSSATQLINVRDSSEPVLTGVPAATQITCDAPLPVADVTASDACNDDLPVVYEQVEAPGRCPGEKIILRVWTATDACGNAAVGTQEVVVTDGSAPTLSNVPAAVELACGDALPTSLPTAGDDCGGEAPEISFADETEVGACANSYRVVRTFTATDKCGNATTASQVIAFRDETAPSIANVPAAATLACGEALPQGEPTATDACDEDVAIALDERTIGGDCANRYQVLRTWTATDDCGNASTATQLLTVTDDEAPDFADVPRDVEVGCGESIPDDEPTATDNCDTDVVVFLTEERAEQSGGYTLTRVWTASDACGNSATASQVITVAASGRPTFAFVPEDLTLGCNESIPEAEAMASDGCGGTVDIERTERRRDGRCVGSYTLTRTWTATSSSGKTARATQIITVADEDAPVFSVVPRDVQLSCGEALPTDDAQAEDGCGGRVRVTVEDERDDGDCAASRTVRRVFTASDDCGNEATAVQTITYRDEVAPTFTYVPNSEEYQCSLGEARDRARATDDCSRDVEVTYADVAPSTDCAQRLQRVWTATDECGNTATAVQQILLEDTERPTLIGVPDNVSIDLGDGGSVPAPARVTATDGCDSAPAVTLDEETVPGQGCSYVIVRTWQVVDRCGNSARGTQRISVTGDGEATSIRVDQSGECATARVAVSSVSRPGGARYAWTASGGRFEDATAPETVFLPEGPGRYAIQLTVTADGCSGSASEALNVQSASLQATGNGPVCVGETIRLTASTGADSYAWTGPNGFAAAEANPVITDATAAQGGSYRVTAVFGDCTQEATVDVAVSADLGIDLRVPTAACAGASLPLSLTGASEATWRGPAGETYVGTSVTAPASASVIGRWSVTASTGACSTARDFVIDAATDCGDGGGGGCGLSTNAALQIEAIGCDQTTGSMTVPVDSPALYTFRWTPDVSATDEATGLAAGDYAVLVSRDSDTSCRRTYAGTVARATAFAVTARANPAGCDSLGDVTILPSVVGDYRVQWRDLDAPSAALSRQALAAGSYTFVVTDADGCSQEETIVVGSTCVCEAAVSIVRAGAASVCLAGDTEIGIVKVRPPVIPLGASERFVLVDGGTGRILGINETGVFVVRAAGAYSIHQLIAPLDELPPGLLVVGAEAQPLIEYVGERRGGICAAFTDFGAPVEVEACCPTPVVAGAVTSDSGCGAADGAATVTLANPRAGDVFAWTPDAGAVDASVPGRRTGLPAGTYAVRVQRAGDPDCATETTLTIGNGAIAVGEPSVTAATCNAADGRVVFASDGSAYVYAWSDGGAGASRDDLAGGDYTVTVSTVDGGCSETIEVSVPTRADFEATAEILSRPTCGEADGSVRIAVGGETRGWTYDWSDGPRSGNPLRDDLAAGAYTVIVTDAARGCADTIRFVLGDDVGGGATITARDVGLDCFSDRTGEADYDIAFDDDFVAPPMITVVDADGVTARPSQLTPGRYSVLVRDGNGCLAGSAGFDVTVPTPLDIEVSGTPATCAAGGTLRLMVSGGRPPYRYDFEDVGGASDPEMVSDLEPGTYTARVTDAGGCVTRLAGLLVEDACGDVGGTTPPIDTTLRRRVGQGFSGEDCFGALDFGLDARVITVRDVCDDAGNGARADLSFDADTQCFSYLGLLPGTDSLCLEFCTADACDTLALIVEVLSPKPETIERQLEVGQDAEACLDLTEVSLPVTEVFNFCESESGDAVAFGFDAETNCVTYVGLRPGTERACYVVCNAFLCDTTFISVTVTEPVGDLPPVAVDDTEATVVNTPVVIDVLANDTLNGPLVEFVFERLPDNGTLFLEAEGVIRYTPNPGSCGRVDSFAYAINNGFAFDEAVVRIPVACDELVIVTGFSPNGDGVNDFFRIIGIEAYPDNTLMIFNRWGNEVFDVGAYDNSADKAFTGRWDGKDLPDGTYFYVLDLKDGEGIRSGYVQIQR